MRTNLGCCSGFFDQRPGIGVTAGDPWTLTRHAFQADRAIFGRVEEFGNSRILPRKGCV